MKSENIDQIAIALSKAQSEMRGALKDSTNPFFKSKYADLQSVWDAIREPLTKNGLSITQTTDFYPEAHTCVVTTLMHVSGQWIEGRLPISATKPEPQAMGSAISYARRYALAAIVGIYQTDDDAAESATNHKITNATTGATDALPFEQVGPAKGSNVCCGQRMLVSKFNTEEVYCPKCKRKEPRAA